MSAAERFAGVTFEELVTEGFAGTRQGAVIVVESKVLPTPRMRWLARQIEQLVPDGVVHFASEGLCVLVLRHAGPAETWLTVERMRRQFTAEQGWERTVVGSATWPVQGSTPMDVIAAALASLYDERERAEQEWGEVELRFEHDEHAERWASAGELLTG
ncbi:MAG: hypothetical protein QM817_23325 [Archangium sp.]